MVKQRATTGSTSTVSAETPDDMDSRMLLRVNCNPHDLPSQLARPPSRRQRISKETQRRRFGIAVAIALVSCDTSDAVFILDAVEPVDRYSHQLNAHRVLHRIYKTYDPVGVHGRSVRLCRNHTPSFVREDMRAGVKNSVLTSRGVA